MHYLFRILLTYTLYYYSVLDTVVLHPACCALNTLWMCSKVFNGKGIVLQTLCGCVDNCLTDIYVCDRVHRDARWTGGLSLTRIAIYPAYAIHCERLWSVPAVILGLGGVKW